MTRSAVRRRALPLLLALACPLLAGRASALLTASDADPIVVTASRYGQRAAEAPVMVTVVSSADVMAAPARALDDILRVLAGVNMRSGSSNIINPAPQSMSMLGVGGNTRALVLLDGLPLTDGFGGWINWSKVPNDVVERVEVVRGGASSLYGTAAMSGVMNILTRSPRETAADLNLSYGSRNTERLNAYASGAFLGKFGVGVDFNDYKTDGYDWLQADKRGTVDNRATARNWTLQVKAASLDGGAAGPLWFVRGIAFHDARNHGLDQFFDSRDELETAAGFRRPMDDGGEVRGNAFVGKHLLDSTNAFVNATRTKEYRYVRNYLPSLDSGANLQYSRPFEALASSATLGVDVRHVSARNNEDDYSTTGVYQQSISSGGQQTDLGVYAQWSAEPVSGLTVVPSARVDWWRNHDAFQVNPNGKTSPIPSKNFAFFSPRLAARYQVNEPLAVRGAVYRAFTAPTLQNLYRGARPQNQIQLPNADLGPEILRFGSEVGADVSLDGLLLRATAFWSEISDAISAVTVKSGVTKVQNVSAVRSRGVAVEAPWRFADAWTLSPAYTYTNATITSNVASPTTVGNMIPDIPRHQAALSLTFDDPRILTAQVRARYLSRRWGNDTNTQNLDEYLVLDASASRWLTKNLEVYVDGENLFDRTYTSWQLGSLPVLGEPLYVGGGVRLHYR